MTSNKNPRMCEMCNQRSFRIPMQSERGDLSVMLEYGFDDLLTHFHFQIYVLMIYVFLFQEYL